MSYLDKLNPQQKQNAAILVQEMKNGGITNPYTWSAILAVISKESEFNPAASEVSYAGTPNDRIRTIFANAKSLDDTKLTALKQDKKKFFDFVYNMSTLGNGPTDGYNYRGRGYNQLTGRANYANIGNKIGVDLVNHPDLLATPEVAAKAAVQYFKDGVNTLNRMGRLSSDYNATDINGFKNETDSLGAIYNVNAGPGATKAHLAADVTGGKAKATSRIGDLLGFVKTNVSSAATSVVTEAKKKPLITILITAGLIISVYVLVKTLKKK